MILRNLQRITYVTVAFAALAVALSLRPSTPIAHAAAPVVDPIPNQIANGGYATTPGLPANAIQIEVSWTDSDVGEAHDVIIDWGDGNVETFPNASNPHVAQHSYAETGSYYTPSAKVVDAVTFDPTVFFDVAVLDIPAPAEAKLISGTFTNSTFRFGQALDFDGDRAVVGSPFEPSVTQTRGKVHIYTRNGSLWTLEQSLQSQPQGFEDEKFGAAVSLDGDAIAVGVESYETTPGVQPGAVIMFHRVGGVWTQGQTIVPADGADNDAFGWAVELRGDRLAVGAPLQDRNGSSNAGAVYLYERDAAGVWNFHEKLTATTTPNHAFGLSLALEGTTLVAGRSGAIYGYEWTFGSALPSPAIRLGLARFGASVAIDGSRVVVGEPAIPQPGALSSGGVHVLFFLGSEFDVEDVVGAAPGQFNLGLSVDIEADRIVAQARGASGRDTIVIEPGGAGGWEQTAVYTPATVNSGAGETSAQNGRLAISGDRVLSGEVWDIDTSGATGNPGGAVYVWSLTESPATPTPTTSPTPTSTGTPTPTPTYTTTSTATPTLTDTSTPTLTLEISVSERIDVQDDVRMFGPVSISVVERIDVRDDVRVLGPVSISVVERIDVIDDAGVTPPLLIHVGEQIDVTDAAAVKPPLLISVHEGVAVSDDVMVRGPVTILVIEDVGVSDAVTAEADTADDGDGIEDAIDGAIEGGAFESEAGVFSSRFTDEHLGGTTFGTVLDRGGLEVTVADAASATDGVSAAIAGGAGEAEFAFCPENWLWSFAPGTAFTMTCGSIIVTVHTGEGTLFLENGELRIPAGATVTVTEDGGTTTVENDPHSTANALLVVGGVQVPVAPGDGVLLAFGCLGDVNGDGAVSIADVTRVLRAMFTKPGHRRWNEAADVNNSGRVDSNDLTIVIRSLLDPACRGEPKHCAGDVNGDGHVDGIDALLVLFAIGSEPGRARWNPDADLNADGRISMRDLQIVLRTLRDSRCS